MREDFAVLVPVRRRGVPDGVGISRGSFHLVDSVFGRLLVFFAARTGGQLLDRDVEIDDLWSRCERKINVGHVVVTYQRFSETEGFEGRISY